MNEDGTAIEPVAVSMETAIPVCTGVMVKADNTGESVTFSKTAPDATTSQGYLQIAVAQANTRGTSAGSVTALDKAIVSFNAGDRLEKFVFNKGNASISIPQEGKELAIAYTGHQDEVPLNFKATKNGQYTISVNAEEVELNYLHLIDNMTGMDVNLLPLLRGQGEFNHPATYTFDAKTTDYASRFRLVFATNTSEDSESDSFAFINSSGNLIIYGIEGEATLQVVDVLGHVLTSETFSGSYEKKLGVAPSAYMLRLINGDDVKVQKVVVR